MAGTRHNAPLLGLALGLLLTVAAVHGGGGLQLGPATQVEMGLELLGGAALALAVLVVPVDRRPSGGITVALMVLLAIWTAWSITWAIQPSDAWIEANRTFSYLMVLVAGVALVRLAPNRWGALLGATLILAGAISIYALATVVLPSWLSPDEIYARLREPYGYWNAVGLTAAMGVPGCLWWGTRRDGHRARAALSAPLLTLLILTLLLSYSRGALLAVAVAVVAWLIFVPLRLRSLALLGIAGAGAATVALWTFGQDALSQDHVPIDARDVAGHRLGLLIIATVVFVLAAYLAITFLASRHPASGAQRRNWGIAVIAALALVPVAGAVMLTASQRGLGGSISHGWSSLTDPHAITPPNDPSRLTAVGSVRSRYWNEALKIFQDHPWRGVGADGYATARPRYREDRLEVRDAHGYGVQTLADLGIIGAALSLALLAAWLTAAGRAIAIRTFRSTEWTAERVGLAALTSIVVTFGVHSFVDWTWFIPGNVIVALLCAGWVAGRGPWSPPPTGPGPLAPAVRTGLRNHVRVALAVTTMVVAGAMVWTTWQPQRSVSATTDALDALASGHPARARRDVQDAVDLNPLSADPYFVRAAIAQRTGNVAAGRQALNRAVQLQPANPATWLTLAQYELRNGRPNEAIARLGPALFLDPRSIEVQQTFLQARAALAATAATSEAAAAKKAAAKKAAAARHHKGR